MDHRIAQVGQDRWRSPGPPHQQPHRSATHHQHRGGRSGISGFGQRRWREPVLAQAKGPSLREALGRAGPSTPQGPGVWCIPEEAAGA